jgi:hypothetical protein
VVCSGLCCQHLCGANVPTWMVRHLTAIIPLYFNEFFQRPLAASNRLWNQPDHTTLALCRYGETNSEMSKRYQTFVTPAGTKSHSPPNPFPAITPGEHRGTIEASASGLGSRTSNHSSHIPLAFPTVGAPVSMAAPSTAENTRSEPLLLLLLLLLHDENPLLQPLVTSLSCAAGWAFSIWGYIYLSQAAFTIYILLPSCSEYARLAAVPLTHARSCSRISHANTHAHGCMER